MIVLAGAERSVRVVLDRGQSSASKTWSAARWLQDGGVEVLVPRRRASEHPMLKPLGVRGVGRPAARCEVRHSERNLGLAGNREPLLPCDRAEPER
jgi:hypothetical protein